ncbi:hypothetical protein AAE478_002798 [Parahypoxylon ruwenzoriense]
MAVDDPSDNPFIRFKNHIDNHIYRGFQTIFGPVMTMDTHRRNDMSSNNPSHTLSRINPESAPSDSRIPSQDGASAPADTNGVLSWATSSPYSPVNLQSLAQPRPNDAPHDYPNSFTFRDAFEDLLAVNSGQTLSDLHGLVFAKHFEHIRYFPWGMPVEDWVSSVGRRGLWDAYFPLSSRARRQLSYGSLILPWGGTLQNEDAIFRQPEVSTWPRMGFPAFEHDRSEWRHGRSKCKKRERRREREAEAFQPREADSEGDMYVATQSEFATDNRVSTEAGRERPSKKTNFRWNDDPLGYEESPGSETIETPDGGKILKTVQQRNYDGGTEVTTTTQRFDADGNLIAQGERTTKTWSYGSPKGSLSDAEPNDEVDVRLTTQKDKKSSGWFWTR